MQVPISYTSLAILASVVCCVIATDPAISKTMDFLATKTPAEIDQACIDWHRDDTGAPKDVSCCPPNADDIKKLEYFELIDNDDLKLYNPDADIGYMQRVPSKSGAGQRCVYKKGTLLIGPPSGGNVQKVSPNGNGEEVELAHFVADTLPRIVCCGNNNPANCKLFYEKRPSDEGHCYGQ